MLKGEISVDLVVKRLGGVAYGNKKLIIKGFSPYNKSIPETVSYVGKFVASSALSSCKSAVLIIPEKESEFSDLITERNSKNLSTIIFSNPRIYFSRLISLFENTRENERKKLIHHSAIIDPSVNIENGVQVGPNVVIQKDVTVMENSVIGAGSFIGESCVIGRSCVIYPNVTIYKYVTISEGVKLHAGVVVGSDGFGYEYNEEDYWEKINQIAGVFIDKNVEIGANSAIDRGTLECTYIGDNVKIDNLVHIAHNVSIGSNTLIAGCVGIAGSAKIGANCQIGGAAGILGHLEISDHTIIGPMSTVHSSIKEAGKYVGIFPIQKDFRWKRTYVLLNRLQNIFKN